MDILTSQLSCMDIENSRFTEEWCNWSERVLVKCDFDYCSSIHFNCLNCGKKLTCLEYMGWCEDFNGGYGCRDGTVVCDTCIKYNEYNNICVGCKMYQDQCVCSFDNQ